MYPKWMKGYFSNPCDIAFAGTYCNVPLVRAKYGELNSFVLFDSEFLCDRCSALVCLLLHRCELHSATRRWFCGQQPAATDPVVYKALIHYASGPSCGHASQPWALHLVEAVLVPDTYHVTSGMLPRLSCV